jgi:hypothetical protein
LERSSKQVRSELKEQKMNTQPRNPLFFGLVTAATLVGGLIGGIAAGSLVHAVLPGHEILRSGIAAIPALAGLIGGGAAWGWAMGRLAHAGEPRRMMWAGALGFSLTAFAMIFILLGLEGAVEEVLRTFGLWPVPIHRVFTILFAPTAVLLAGSGAWALGRALRQPGLAWRLALPAGLAGGAAFLAVNLTMEALGWVVGAPGAAERATMLTVLGVSCIGASLAGGTTVGYQLNKHIDVQIFDPGPTVLSRESV